MDEVKADARLVREVLAKQPVVKEQPVGSLAEAMLLVGYANTVGQQLGARAAMVEALALDQVKALAVGEVDDETRRMLLYTLELVLAGANAMLHLARINDAEGGDPAKVPEWVQHAARQANAALAYGAYVRGLVDTAEQRAAEQAVDGAAAFLAARTG